MQQARGLCAQRSGRVSVVSKSQACRPLAARALSIAEKRRLTHARASFLGSRSASAQKTAQKTAAPEVPAAPDQPSGQDSSDYYGTPLQGCPKPFGSQYRGDLGEAYNFALHSSTAAGVTLVLFTQVDLQQGRPTLEIELDPLTNRTGNTWHIALPGLNPDWLYGYRVAGRHQGIHRAADGLRHDASRVLVDPYATAVVSRTRWGQPGPALDYDREDVLGLAATWPQAAAALPPAGASGFDWRGDRPLNTPMAELVIYEAHVRGFTADPESGVLAPGTYMGMVERLDYLQTLGVNAIELLPVFDFNELEYYSPIPGTDAHRFNFWGYSTANFFAPMPRYSAAAITTPNSRGGNQGQGRRGQAQQPPHFDPHAAGNELKLLVREAHARGIEVILDVVFNHTNEGNEEGPTMSFRGLDNRTYYMLAPQGQYYNYSGCGNTVNCNDPIARELILDCLRFWVQEYHIDGFRFDLASILTRAPSAWYPSDWSLEDPEASPLLTDPEPSDADLDPASSSDDPSSPDRLSRMVRATELSEETLFGIDRTPEFSSDLTSDFEDETDDDLTDDGGVVSSAVLSSGAVLCDAGFMTDGAGVPTGTPLADPPLIEMISEDPLLRDTKMIAEAWDCDGLVQVGAFPHYGGRWGEWNGGFRDSVRNFIKGSEGNFIGAFAASMMGSPDSYARSEADHDDWWGNNGGAKWRGGRSPQHSVNFVTAHDGFSLADLVSYNEKRNALNGEDNKDGENHNLSWNCGEEGLTDNVRVQRLRQRQMRNFAASLLTAQGVPMVLMGDEYGHTKGGNNNTYCHDSALNYVNWKATTEDAHGLRRFWQHMITLRKTWPELAQSHYLHGNQVEWYGPTGGAPDWDAGRFLGMVLKGSDHAADRVFIAFNTSHVPVMATVPPQHGPPWELVADTSAPAPRDILIADERLSRGEVDATRREARRWLEEGHFPMMPWSCVIFEARE